MSPFSLVVIQTAGSFPVYLSIVPVPPLLPSPPLMSLRDRLAFWIESHLLRFRTAVELRVSFVFADELEVPCPLFEAVSTRLGVVEVGGDFLDLAREDVEEFLTGREVGQGVTEVGHGGGGQVELLMVWWAGAIALGRVVVVG